MSIRNFMKVPKHQRFDFKPQYYDEEKEKLEARVSHIKDGVDSSEAVKSGISRGFQRRSASGYRGSQEYSRSNKRLLIILIFLVVLTFVFIVTYLPQIVALVE